MIFTQVPRGTWNDKETIKAEALKYKHRVDFQKQSSGAYDAALRLHIVDEVCSHMKAPDKTRKWTLEKMEEEALKYTSRNDFKKGCGSAYRMALRKGVLNDICKHMNKG
jgi:hypothetical protein